MQLIINKDLNSFFIKSFISHKSQKDLHLFQKIYIKINRKI